jgi:hypothetical protein
MKYMHLYTCEYSLMMLLIKMIVCLIYLNVYVYFLVCADTSLENTQTCVQESGKEEVVEAVLTL